MEIERKWLVKGWPEALAPAAVYTMRQGYISVRPTVRIRQESTGGKDEYVLCFKGPAGPDGLAREEIESPIEPGLFHRLENFIAKPLIEKEQRRYQLDGGLTLEVNEVDKGQPDEFFYAEIEFENEQAAREWKPGVLKKYLDEEVTDTPGQSMAAYWRKTRGLME